jgi:tubulin polyglutamylase TTLL6/13
MLDEGLDPILIEVNHAPSFATDSNLDFNLKKVLIQDTFKMLNMSLKRRSKYRKEYNKIAQNRIFKGRKE